MTYEQREAIFAKEVITLTEMEMLLDCSKSTACQAIQAMKRRVGDRLGIQGKIHIQDYFLAMRIDPDQDRYKKLPKEKEDGSYGSGIRRSVNCGDY